MKDTQCLHRDNAVKEQLVGRHYNENVIQLSSPPSKSNHDGNFEV